MSTQWIKVLRSKYSWSQLEIVLCTKLLISGLIPFFFQGFSVIKHTKSIDTFSKIYSSKLFFLSSVKVHFEKIYIFISTFKTSHIWHMNQHCPLKVENIWGEKGWGGCTAFLQRTWDVKVLKRSQVQWEIQYIIQLKTSTQSRLRFAGAIWRIKRKNQPFKWDDQATNEKKLHFKQTTDFEMGQSSPPFVRIKNRTRESNRRIVMTL